MTATPEAAPAIDFSTFDTSVRVQDDLFRHVNGTWIRETEIPADKSITGSFVALRDVAEQAVRAIITGLDPADCPPGSERRKIADLFASFTDEERVEELGASPLSAPLARIDAVVSPADLMKVLGGFTRAGVPGLIGIETESDPGDPQRYVMFVGQSGLGLPDEEYYRLEGYATIREQYTEHVRSMLELAGVDHPAAAARLVFELETEIAAHPLGQGEVPGHAAHVQPHQSGRLRSLGARSCTGGGSWPGRTSQNGRWRTSWSRSRRSVPRSVRCSPRTG